MKNCSLLTEFHLSVVVDRRIKETEEIIYYIQGVFDYCCLVRLEKVTVCENCPKKVALSYLKLFVKLLWVC